MFFHQSYPSKHAQLHRRPQHRSPSTSDTPDNPDLIRHDHNQNKIFSHLTPTPSLSRPPPNPPHPPASTQHPALLKPPHFPTITPPPYTHIKFRHTLDRRRPRPKASEESIASADRKTPGRSVRVIFSNYKRIPTIGLAFCTIRRSLRRSSLGNRDTRPGSRAAAPPLPSSGAGTLCGPRSAPCRPHAC